MALNGTSFWRPAASFAVLLWLAGCSTASKVLETYDLPAASAVSARAGGAKGR